VTFRRVVVRPRRGLDAEQVFAMCVATPGATEKEK